MQGTAPDRFVAFLGSINVGGHRAKAEQLRAPFEALGHLRVGTFLASGNVIFDAGRPQPAEQLAAELSAALAAELGFGVPVYLRTAAEVRAITGARPFSDSDLADSRGKHQVMLLAGAEDRLAFGDRELHWLPSGGVSDSALDHAALGSLLGPLTIRTRNTIARIEAGFLG